jgi:Flp pilus assembly pilin Flp
MNRITRTSPALTLAVRTQVAAGEARHVILSRAERRLARLRDDGEAGAQSAEYAMLGGVGAAACAGLIALLKNEDFLKKILDAVLTALTKVIRTWF